MVRKKKQKIDYFELHEQIMHGDATPPPIFSIKGFGYARWLSHNKKHVEDSKHQFNMAGGTEPVRGEKSFSRSTM